VVKFLKFLHGFRRKTGGRNSLKQEEGGQQKPYKHFCKYGSSSSSSNAELMPPSSRPWTASMFLPLLSLLALQPIHSSEYHYPTDLKCQDLHGAASGCSVSFPGWREDTLVPTSELVCSVAIQASIRSYPLTCPSYQLQQIQISKPSSPYKQSLAYSTPPSNIKTCKHFSDLSLHLEHSNQTDLMDQWFCPYGIQPESCENSAPQLDITTAAWNATQCAQESCGDGYPLSLNVNLIVRTLPKSSCPTADTVHNQPCSGTMDRSDNLPRGHCGCRTLYHGDQQGPLLTCTCAYGYFGQSCQAECPAGTFVPGQSGLANCCSGHGTPSATVLKSNEVLVVCKCHLGWGGEACATAMPCAAGTYGPNCDQVCSCNGIGNQPDGACDKDTGLCLCLSDHWNAGCTDCNSKRAFGPTCMSQCPACDGTGAVAPGMCHSGVHGDGTCACKGMGWNEGCTNCKTNVYGPNCDQQCNCTRVEHASCLSAGIHGTGGCGCTPPFNHALDGTCNNCQPGYFGRHCEECTCNSGSTTNHEQCNDGYNGTGSCICRPGWSGPDCKQSTNDDGGKIPFWVVPVVAVALVIVGFILFFVLYKRQNKIFRGGSSRSATNSPWNSQTSGLMRGRSVDLTRPLLSPQSNGINSSRGSTNSPRNRYPTANIATVAVNSSPTMNKRGRTNSGLMNMMDLLLDSDDAGTRHHRRSSAHRIVEQFDKLLLSTSNGGGGFDYTIDYSMLSMGVKIGSGASGEVFTATVDPQNNTEEPIVVAVKRLYADTVDKDYFVSGKCGLLCWWGGVSVVWCASVFVLGFVVDIFSHSFRELNRTPPPTPPPSIST
jgi:hypothetical protein